MTVSAEGFLIGNLLLDSLILWLSSRMIGHDGGKTVFLGGGLGAAYALCAYLPWGRFMMNPFLRLIVCGGMVALTYLGSVRIGWKRYAKHVATAFLCTILLGGTGTGLLFAMGQRGWGIFPAMLTAGIGTIAIAALTVRRNRVIAGKPVRVTVTNKNETITFMACVDTGNVLVEPLSNLPVIVAERQALQGIEEGTAARPVPFCTVGGKGRLFAFAPDSVAVDGAPVEALLGAFDGTLGIEEKGLVPGRLMREGGAG